MKQRKKYPKTAKAVAGVALLLVVISFKAPAMLLLAAWFGLIALILALGPDRSSSPTFRGSDTVLHNGKTVTRSEAGYSCYRY